MGNAALIASAFGPFELLSADFFQRANGALTTTWVNVFGEPTNFVVSGNKAIVTDVKKTCTYLSTKFAAWPADQYSAVVLGTPASPVARAGYGPALRCSASARTYYTAYADAVGWFTAKMVAGTISLLGASDSTAFADGDTAVFAVQGTQLAFYRASAAGIWTLLWNGTDGDIGNGAPGISSYGSADNITTASIRTWYGGRATAIIASSGVPPQVMGLDADAVSSTEIDLAWNANPNTTSYNVYQFGVLIQSGVVTTTYAVHGLTPSTSYTFTVSAVNAVGEGPQSAPDSDMTQSGGSTPFDYYISTSGSNGNPGTLASPWAISAINSKGGIYSGKRVGLIGPATYNVGSMMSAATDPPALNINGGTPNASTYIAPCDGSGNYAPRTVTITANNGHFGGGNANQCAMIGQGLGAANAGYVILDGFVLSGASIFCLLWGNHANANVDKRGLVTQNCEITGNSAINSTVASGVNVCPVQLFQGIGARFLNNYIHDNAGWTDSTHFSAYYQWTSQGTIWKNNTLINSGGLHGKETGNQGTIIQYNYIDWLAGTGGQNNSCIQGFDGADGSGTVLTQPSQIDHNILLSDYEFMDLEAELNNGGWTTPCAIFNNTMVAVSGGIANDGVRWFEQSAGSRFLKLYNNLFYDSGGHAPSGYGYVIANADAFALADYNLYGTSSPKWTTVTNGGHDSGGAATVNTLPAWRTATGAEAHSVSGIAAFTNTGGLALQYGVTGGAAFNTGRVGGVSGGAAVNIGASDNTGSIGCNFIGGSTAKWTPGHYMLSDTQPAYPDALATFDSEMTQMAQTMYGGAHIMKGYKVTFTWYWLEYPRGTYRFDFIDHCLAKLRSLSSTYGVTFKLIIEVGLSSSGNQCVPGSSGCAYTMPQPIPYSGADNGYRGIVPDWIVTGISGHGSDALSTSNHVSLVAAWWRGQCNLEYCNLLKKLGQTYDGDPNVEMIVPTQETSQALDSIPGDYTSAASIQGWKNIIDTTVTYWPACVKVLNNNYNDAGTTINDLANLSAYAASKGVGFGGPDILYASGGNGYESYGEQIMKGSGADLGSGPDYRGTIPCAFQEEADYSNWTWETAAGVESYTYNTLAQTHTMWGNHYTYGGSGKNWSDVIAALNSVGWRINRLHYHP